MTKTQIQQLVVGLLLVLFVGVFLLSKKSSETVTTTVSSPQAVPSAERHLRGAEPGSLTGPAAPVDLSVSRDIFLLPNLLTQRLQQKELEAQQLEQQKNTREAGGGPSLQSGDSVFKLQGIFWGSAKPQAIINRQIVSVGDRVENAEVESISKDSVTLSLNGQKIDLKPEISRPKSKQEDRTQK